MEVHHETVVEAHVEMNWDDSNPLWMIIGNWSKADVGVDKHFQGDLLEEYINNMLTKAYNRGRRDGPSQLKLRG